jgi:hypothetical protein
VSAVGVWGTPLEVASRASDILAALPTAQLLKKRYSLEGTYTAHTKMLQLIQDAGRLLNHQYAQSPFMLREKLLGR